MSFFHVQVFMYYTGKGIHTRGTTVVSEWVTGVNPSVPNHQEFFLKHLEC